MRGSREVSRPGRAPGKTCEVDECRQEAGKCMPSPTCICKSEFTVRCESPVIFHFSLFLYFLLCENTDAVDGSAYFLSLSLLLKIIAKLNNYVL